MLIDFYLYSLNDLHLHCNNVFQIKTLTTRMDNWNNAKYHLRHHSQCCRITILKTVYVRLTNDTLSDILRLCVWCFCISPNPFIE